VVETAFPSQSSLSPDEAQLVGKLCTRFEAAWQLGERPRIEDHRPEVPEAVWPVLLRELLALEVAYRVRRGEQIGLEEYCRRFPEFGVKLAPLLVGLLAEQATLVAKQSPVPNTVADSVPLPSALTGAPSIPGYDILSELGKGGQGVVYKAWHRGLKRLVALKMIRPDQLSETEQTRFNTDAQTISQFQNPHIVQIYDIGEWKPEGSGQSLPYFALEFCPGGSLARKLAATPQPPTDAAKIVETLSCAVQAAHDKNVIHRDLKPANVLLDADGRLKITDFGLAKKLDDDGQTHDGAIKGTPSYMAPEQAAGRTEEVGTAADVYALGAILYECLTGRPPFRGATLLDTLELVRQREPVPPRELQPKTPRDLETVCLKCLHKERGRRYGSAAELADDLGRFLRHEPIRARPVGAVERTWKLARRRPALAALLGVVLLALAALAVLSGNLAAARNDADEKRKTAEKEADKARKARDFLVSILKLADRKGEGGTLTARQILDDADRRIAVQFADQPELRADLEAAIEEVYASLGTTGPQAMILEAQGTVRLVPVRNEKRQAVPQTLLYHDDRLILGVDGDVRLLFLQDFHKERLKPGSEVTIRRRGCQPGEAVAERQDDLFLTFVRLPKGTFFMGGGGGDAGKKTEIKEDFEIAAHAVTQYQWQAVMGGNQCYFSRFGGGATLVKDISDDELRLFPVEQVSWNDVQEFLKKLNEKERGHGYFYRLPSEAEWEYACRGRTTSEEECSYHFYFDKPTNDLSSKQANFNGESPFGKGEKGSYLGRPTKVGSYAPNKLGLYDMHGNVWQWTDTVEDSYRVYRGGSWYGSGNYCQASFRYRDGPTERVSNVGFRLARNPAR
jgi:formylglycine-generating enzyme required for sulfatase activity